MEDEREIKFFTETKHDKRKAQEREMGLNIAICPVHGSDFGFRHHTGNLTKEESIERGCINPDYKHAAMQF